MHAHVRCDQVRTPEQPWPKPLSPAELAHWLDVLGNYTEAAPAGSKKGAAPNDMYVRLSPAFCAFFNTPHHMKMHRRAYRPALPPQSHTPSDTRGVENPLGHLHASKDGPVNIKRWVEQGKCKHADKYLAQILDRLRVWSNGGISRGMIEEAVRVGRDRSGFAALHYQVGLALG